MSEAGWRVQSLSPGDVYRGVSMCTMTPVGRTNVVVDDELVERVMRLYGLRTKREAIDFALRRVAGEGDRKRMLELEGTGWGGDLEEMRRGDPPIEL
jgi:Arc/MetJ family transcription regulator